GNLVRKRDIHGATWRYGWNGAGMLTCVRRPDNREITFRYDALGRRIEKRSGHRVTQWIWDGNVPLHEIRESRTPSYSEERGTFDIIAKDPAITWLFEEGTFVPAAKITGKEKLSIVSNYMGTPEAMYRDYGKTRSGHANSTPVLKAILVLHYRIEDVTTSDFQVDY
ncbi:MAG: hypothetical protein LBE56_10405, partial [Tannerella sp.]|nr:hypothetical protein [Tannerella sp.]